MGIHHFSAVRTIQVASFERREEKAKRMRPDEKHAMEITRKNKGDLLIHMRTHHGTWSAGDRLKYRSVRKQRHEEEYTDYIDCFHVTARRLFTAEPALRTSDVNQNALTAF